MKRLLLLLFLLPLFTFGQAPTDDSTRLSATGVTPSSINSKGANASNLQVAASVIPGKWFQYVIGYQFNHYTGTSTQAQIALRELLSNKTATASSSTTTYPNWLGVENYVSGFVPTSLSATSPIFYNNSTGVISSQPASSTQNGYMTNGTQNIGGAKTYNSNQLLNDSTNNTASYTVYNTYNGNSANSRMFVQAYDAFGNNANYGAIGVFSSSFTGLNADLAGNVFIQSGGNSKGIINFFDGPGSWRVSSQKPLLTGQHFSNDIVVPSASLSYSRPSPGVGFGTDTVNIARTDSMTRALTVRSPTRSLIELVNTGIVTNGTLVGSIYGYSHQAVANTVGRMDWINTGTHYNSGSWAIGTYRSGTYHQALLIDSNQIVYLGGTNTPSTTGNNEPLNVQGNINADFNADVKWNQNTGTTARVVSTFVNGGNQFTKEIFYSHTNATNPDRYAIFNSTGDMAFFTAGTPGLTLNTDQTISPGVYATGTAGTSPILVNVSGKIGSIPGNSYAPASVVGSVTNVSSANADIGVATGTTTPVLTFNRIPAYNWIPSATLTYNLGSTSFYWNNIYANQISIVGAAQVGGLTSINNTGISITNLGAVTAPIGWTNTSSGNSTNFMPATISGNATITVPNSTGTIALTNSNPYNLTGVITSVGNATSIASQTGTGTKFVMDTSPTLVTPNIGVASGTSLALSGNTNSGLFNIASSGNGNYQAGSYFNSRRADLAIGAYDVSYTDVPLYAGNSVIQAGGQGTGISNLILSSWESGGTINMYTGGRASGNLALSIASNQRVTIASLINLPKYTVATLPTGSIGDVASVTDALTPSFLVLVVGGGSTYTAVIKNATQWVVF